MEIIVIKKSDHKQIYKLAVEENKILRRYSSQPIYQVTFTKGLFEQMFKHSFGDNKAFFGIKDGDNIIAMLSGYIKPAPRGDVGYIDNMFVSKKHLGRGYAVVLRNEFYKWLKHKKIKYCQLDVLGRNPAKTLYEKWGFSVDGFQMTKKL